MVWCVQLEIWRLAWPSKGGGGGGGEGGGGGGEAGGEAMILYTS